jgi:hypothetical protein
MMIQFTLTLRIKVFRKSCQLRHLKLGRHQTQVQNKRNKDKKDEKLADVAEFGLEGEESLEEGEIREEDIASPKAQY